MLSISFILTLLISIFTSSYSQVTCASGWVQNEGKCYLINPLFNSGSTSGTWVQCNAYCSTSYSDAMMFCVDNAAVNSWLTSKFSGQAFWIGYTVMPPFGGGKGTKQFGWVTGCSSTYTNWEGVQPDGGDDVYTMIISNGKWHDHHDQATLQCGCQYTLGLTKAPTFSPSSRPSTVIPTTSRPSTVDPTSSPSAAPSTVVPTSSPSADPSTVDPTSSPSADPSTVVSVVDVSE